VCVGCISAHPGGQRLDQAGQDFAGDFVGDLPCGGQGFSQQVEISQAGRWCNWISLGTYSFSAGTGSYVRLGDYTGGEDPQRSVIADAVQFVWVSGP
jgi:hypothetical protein